MFIFDFSNRRIILRPYDYFLFYYVCFQGGLYLAVAIQEYLKENNSRIRLRNSMIAHSNLIQDNVEKDQLSTIIRETKS